MMLASVAIFSYYGSVFLFAGLPTVNNIPDIVNDIYNDNENSDTSATSATSADQITVDLGIITDVVKQPDFAVLSRREDTFLTWPTTNKKLASEMIEHDLYYTGG